VVEPKTKAKKNVVKTASFAKTYPQIAS
jgi:hypothetical protein